MENNIKQMTVQVLLEVTVPDSAESMYETDNKAVALGAEIAEHISDEVERYLRDEVCGVNGDVKVDYRKYYPSIFLLEEEEV